MKLKKITDNFYMLKHGDFMFTLNKESRGRNFCGKSYFLRMIFQGTTTCIASFVIKDDGYRCYVEDYKSKLWTNVNDILAECDVLIDRIID